MIPHAKTTMGPVMAALLAGLLTATSTGCQSTIAGQTLPSPTYLRDDVQFFPAGPEFKLTNQVQALEQYELEQEALEEGLELP